MILPGNFSFIKTSDTSLWCVLPWAICLSSNFLTCLSTYIPDWVDAHLLLLVKMDQFQDASLSNTHTRKKLLYILACHHGGTHYAYHLCLNWCMLFTRKCFAFDVLLFIWIIFQTLLFIFMLPLTCSSRMHTSKSWTTSPLNVSARLLFFFFFKVQPFDIFIKMLCVLLPRSIRVSLW